MLPDTRGSQDLAQTAAPEPEIAPAAPKIDALGRAYATGRRKEAVARVWLKPGSGRTTVNGRSLEIYFARPVLRMLDQSAVRGRPSRAAVRPDLHRRRRRPVRSGRRGAPRHQPRPGRLRSHAPAALKAGGFLTRDSRKVERKKYGKRKARRSFQFSKR